MPALRVNSGTVGGPMLSQSVAPQKIPKLRLASQALRRFSILDYRARTAAARAE
jgi:hypothetical protein